MARNKVKLAWIANDATRRATLKKRRKGLMKKVRELSILCGVDACVVVYAPHEHQPAAWPSHTEAARMMARFKSMPEIERSRKMVNQEAFLHQRIAKLLEQLRRQQRENREIEMTALVFEGLRGRSLHDLGIEDASALAWMVETKLRAIYEKREEVAKRLAMAPPPPPAPPAAPVVTAAAMLPILPPAPSAMLPPLPPPLERSSPMVHGHGAAHGQAVEPRPNWFMDMMSPWPEQEGQQQQMQMFVDHISPWPDTFLP